MKKMIKFGVLLMCFALVLPHAVKAEEEEQEQRKEYVVTNVNDDFEKVDASLSKYEFTDLEDEDYVVIKQAKRMIVWTQTAVENEEEFVKYLKEANKDKSLKDSYFETITLISGEGAFDEAALGKQFGVYTFEVVDGKVVLTCDASRISHANHGSYVVEKEEVTEPEEPSYHYEWVLDPESAKHVGSATGYANDTKVDFEARTSGDWFRAQHLDFTTTNKYEYSVQVGNPKDGQINEAGTMTVEKNAEENGTYTYTVKYANTDECPEATEEASCKVRKLESARMIVDVDGTKIPYKGGIGENSKEYTETFTTNTLTFDFFLHFDVIEYTYNAVKVLD